MNKKVLIIGAGIGGITTAIRLKKYGYDVEIVEKNSNAGGRLNRIVKDGFTFDMGPTFFSMTYEFEEFLKDTGISDTFEFEELTPLYTVNFRGSDKIYHIYKDLKKLALQFDDIEPDFEKKINKFLHKTGKLFHDTEYRIVKRNYKSLMDYILQLTRVPVRHIPLLYKSFWKEISQYFQSDEVREILSLVAFFLGSTPFDTSAIYTLLTYVELKHNGYYNVKGGMYEIVKFLLRQIENEKIKIRYNTEIVDFLQKKKYVSSFIDHNGNTWDADLFVVNSDAAFFRSRVLKSKKYTSEKLEKMKWTMAPFTIYLGIDCKIDQLHHHNYFLGDNYKEYANNVFTGKANLNKPYYYVNVPSKKNKCSAPEGKESVFILCPVPHLSYKSDWTEKNEFAENIIHDLSKRIDFNFNKNIRSKTVLTPTDWAESFNLYQGSGLGLAHNLKQTAALRPGNTDENYKNVFYVGSSTIPGTGLPMAIISSKLVVERILS